MSKKVDKEKIINETQNRLFPKGEVLHEIDQYKYFNERIGGVQSLGYIALGIGGVVLGVGIIAVGRIFMGIFVAGFGLGSLRKAFSTKAKIDMLNK